jgi:hypothetical protein
MIDNELLATIEKVRKGCLAISSFDRVFLFDFDHGKLLLKLGMELVGRSNGLFLLDEKSLAGCEPFVS